ncbi:GNAT family N-acetyltransferase [Roseivivax isoporae]|uniref:GNAT family N-acetyltransferase n=1 Tax=Roseivivax isoporae TaxID=591206 RepID=UPI0004B29C4F|nr:GNAT family N-acetyltransferase [Roseivivax isoporae]
MTPRRACPDDAPACAAIVRAWLDRTDWMPEGPDLRTLEEAMRAAFAEREVWVVGDPAEGYLSFDPGTSHVRGLYVGRPGAGIGRALLDRAKEGRDRITLDTHVPNRDAHRFYAREGFRVIETDRAGSDGVPELRMEWRR